MFQLMTKPPLNEYHNYLFYFYKHNLSMRELSLEIDTT